MFGGHNFRFRHQSTTLGCPMTFSLFIPASPASNLPVLYWLSGLTCNDENFITKAAAAHGIALVAPDTSPHVFCHNGSIYILFYDCWCSFEFLLLPCPFWEPRNL
ncbi:hypothetical protein E2562_017128 [Oryza meyeriana var. granulata]|uniref:S-formylglutathione hydrolase n=1 Tax=Oryza meyeriana var. granulata TaxID=110450 RepID=A0A6G1DXP1_9ORYZ|nr:hypothetical protein E2562_017128 [Oryza meyeriana var. granulata]KAF0917229.1 hypothetical protein E2562_017128 [Oryza meyeriana var. granulata]KAF0917230.1 hypothetical protein E2562_017128 [Oryza meyeriana var. granulata]KAF0917232.1 hypothetical protein E2562_017128 [Oryza meyeriana var. granulata]KAF0917233.1 hypothetical protein E2562_017128 [Oryza meyeriana var. granulata]